MPAPLELLFCIHNHQPVGNFDSVIREAFDRCYRPFVEELRQHPGVGATLHYTGPILEWILANEPAFFDEVRPLVERRQVEILGGGFYEPMLSVIPAKDARGQIAAMASFCETYLGMTPIGAWLAERVWDPDLPRVLNGAGVQYTLVDDTHFYQAGLSDEPLAGYFTTEKAGAPVAVFPIDRGLRYRIPFRPVDELIAYLKRLYAECGPVVVTYGDDGEKFGLWPGTHDWVWKEKWLARFFDALEKNADWLRATPVGDAFERHAARGTVYLPTASYDEMGEWSLPTDAQARAHEVREKLAARGELEAARPFVRGGIWQNFLSKYGESNWMHKRMLHVSRRSREAGRIDVNRELFQAQCNCAYWHGLFGGLYYQHLRQATWQHLVAAERLLDDDARDYVYRGDIDCDLEDEVLLATREVVAAIRPARGGTLVELDARERATNLLAVLTRRKEAYHARLGEAARGDSGGAPKSIHDIVTVKEPGLEERLVVDQFERASFCDRFFDPEVCAEDLRRARAVELGDFVAARYDVLSVDEGRDWLRVRTVRRGTVEGRPVEVEKRFALSTTRPVLEVAVAVTNLGDVEIPVAYATELSFTLLAAPPAGGSRYAEIATGGAPERRSLAETFLVAAAREARAFDDDRRVGLRLKMADPIELCQFALETVSQSEAGLERTYQGTVWMPIWRGVLASRKERLFSFIVEIES